MAIAGALQPNQHSLQQLSGCDPQPRIKHLARRDAVNSGIAQWEQHVTSLSLA
jgi:hypothetical protein